MEYEEDVFRQALEKAKADLQHWLARRAEADRKIGQLRQTISSLAQLCGVDAEPPKQEDLFDMLLKDEIINVLKAANKPLKPIEIKEGLIRLADYDTKQYVNFMATLHSILKRLETKKVIESVGQGRKRAYQLKLKSDSQVNL